MNNVNIVQAKPNDWLRVRSVRLRALKQDPNAFASKYDDESKYPEQMWLDRLALTEWITFLATNGAEDLGIAVGGPYDDQLGIYAMWVDPSARGKGLGDKLIGAAVNWATSRNAKRVYLDVADSNQPAIDLYKRNCFVRTGHRSSLPAPREHITEHQRVLELGN